LTLETNATPVVNQPAFGFTMVNAPKNSLGLFMVCDAADQLGSDPFGIGVKLHVNLFGASQIWAWDAFVKGGGTGFVPVPIPNIPALAGNTFYAQGLYFEVAGQRCTSSPFGLVTSRGLQFTVF
jgi:hypothetical protein